MIIVAPMHQSIGEVSYKVSPYTFSSSLILLLHLIPSSLSLLLVPVHFSDLGMLLQSLSVHCNCITISNLLPVSWYQCICQILVCQLVPVYQSNLDIPVGTSAPVMVHSIVGFV